MAADVGFLEAKCRELSAHDTEVDVARAAERCRASGDEALRRRFVDLARAVGRESHWLRAAPEATAALLWNRLRQVGWSTDEIEQQLQLPAGPPFLRVRHLATRESPALVRDLVGHALGVMACAVTPDGRRVVSASADKRSRCGTSRAGGLLTHRANAAYLAVATDLTAIIAGDAAGSVWFLDWPL